MLNKHIEAVRRQWGRKMRRKIVLLAGGLSILLLAGGAMAQDNPAISVADPKFVAEVARGYGSVVIEKDSDGDPLLKCRSEGIAYSIAFYNCKADQVCRSIQFRSGFTHKGVKLERINEWNQKKRYAKALLDKEGDPIIRMDFNVVGGISRANLDDVMDLWTRLLKEYVDHIGFKR